MKTEDCHPSDFDTRGRLLESHIVCIYGVVLAGRSVCDTLEWLACNAIDRKQRSIGYFANDADAAAAYTAAANRKQEKA
jgi:hypothetical protein